MLGPLEAQRFCETYDPPPQTFSETVEHRLKRLAALRDRPETWKPQVTSSALRNACELRRHVSEAELIVLAGDPGGDAQVPRRLDRTALGVDLNDLAISLEVVIEGRRGGEKLGIIAAEERARLTTPVLPWDAVRELAESTVGAETRDLALREHGERLDDLINASIELGAIPRSERKRYAEPDGDQFKRLPDSLRRVAKRIDAAGPEPDARHKATQGNVQGNERGRKQPFSDLR